MVRNQKNKNILHILRDRELNSVKSIYNTSLSVIKQLVQSEHSVYEEVWSMHSPKQIIYDDGFLYTENYKTCYTMCGKEGKPSLAFKLKPQKSRKKVVQGISYNLPVQKEVRCKCSTFTNCECLSKFFIYITQDDWMGVINLEKGTLMREVYVKCPLENFPFRFCSWDIYGERFILTSLVSRTVPMPDVAVCVAIFTVFPLEFQVLCEFRRSVFGKNCKHVNVSDQMLIIGMGSDRVHLYSFTDLLSESCFKEYKLGDEYSGGGNIGIYPTPLPLNATISKAPPLLMDVKCFGQSLTFGGFPYQYLYSLPHNHSQFLIKSVREASSKVIVESSAWTDEPDTLFFHPDGSNRIVLRNAFSVHCYELKCLSEPNVVEVFTMDFEDIASNEVRQFSSFGRKLIRKENLSLFAGRNILALDYEDELNLFAVLGFSPKDPDLRGLVKIYEASSGAEVKCVQLKEKLCETNSYQLLVDRVAILILEKNEKGMSNAFVYQLICT